MRRASLRFGALNYIGADEYLAGVAAGEYMVESGKTHVICANTLPGTANIEARCQGMADAMSKAGATRAVLFCVAT